MKKEDPKVAALVKTTGVDVVELTTYRSQATELATFLSAAPCDTPEREAWFDQQLANVRALLKTIEEKRTSITAPLNAAKRSVDALFAPATSPLKDCESVIRHKLLAASQVRLDAERRALAAATDAAKAGRPEAALAALADRPTALESRVGSSSSSRWVVDSCDVTKMPAEYLLPNDDALNALAKAAGDGPAPTVSGVVWKRLATLRARGV